MKKAFVFLFAVCLIALLVPSAWAADSGSCGEGVTWTLVDGTLTISGIGAMTDYEWLDSIWCGNDSIKSIVIQDGVTTIGDNAFGMCTSLTSVIIPDSVSSIGAGAFYECGRLTSVTFPDGLTSIGNGAFAFCGDLTSVTIPDSVSALEDAAFSGCTNLASVALGTGVTSIGDSTFASCSNLQMMNIPNQVITIGDYAFELCTNLKSITIQNGLKSIGVSAFAGCLALESVEIPDTVTEFGPHPFCGCDNLSGIWVDGNNPNYCSDMNGALYNKNGTKLIQLPAKASGEYTIAEGVVSIEVGAFSGCDDLSAITIPSSVISIGDNAFEDCNGLKLVHYLGTEGQRNSIENWDGESNLKEVEWHCEVTESISYGQTVYYCPECGLYYLPDGSEMPNELQVFLAASGFSLSFADEILVNFYYTVSDVTDVTEQGMLVFYTDPGKADFNKADDVYTDSRYVESSGSYIVTTHGIAAKEMGDDRYYCAYAKLSDGSYAYSKLYQYSPKKYATNILSRETASEKQKALCVAMLNYGAAAQEYFGYRPDDLMNAGLTEEQKALVSPYDASLFKGTVPADPGKTGVFIATDGFSGKAASVSFEGAFSINFYFIPNEVADTDLIFYYWTEEDYANAGTLTPTNASGKLSMELKDGFYMASVKGIAPKDLDKTYYVAGAYVSDMQIRCTGVIAYSLSKYCMNNAYGNMGDLARATAMYGYYAKAYFG